MSALRNALKAVKSDIVTVPVKKAPRPTYKKAADAAIRAKQMINGHPVQWASPDDDSRKIPFIQTDRFYVQYPTKNDDIKVPEGTKMATYNKTKRRVEFFNNGYGKGEPIRYVNDARHEPLPVPRFMDQLEQIEEIFDINFETGELTVGIKMDVLPENIHWKLRLQEFEAAQKKHGVPDKHISFRLQKYLKNLEDTRGVTVAQLAEPIPETILDAIEFAKQKLRAAGVKG